MKKFFIVCALFFGSLITQAQSGDHQGTGLKYNAAGASGRKVTVTVFNGKGTGGAQDEASLRVGGFTVEVPIPGNDLLFFSLGALSAQVQAESAVYGRQSHDGSYGTVGVGFRVPVMSEEAAAKLGALGKLLSGFEVAGSVNTSHMYTDGNSPNYLDTPNAYGANPLGAFFGRLSLGYKLPLTANLTLGASGNVLLINDSSPVYGGELSLELRW